MGWLEGQGITPSVALQVASGKVPNVSVVHKYGQNSDVDVGIDEDMWAVGDTWQPLAAAERMSVVSTDAADTVAGAGARSVVIQGLDGNYLLVEETLPLNGTTPVLTSNAYVRVFRAFVNSAGDLDNGNLGNLSVTAETAATPQAFIGIGASNTLLGIYTIPADKTGYMTEWGASIIRSSPAGAAATVELRTRVANDINSPWRVRGRIGLSIVGSSINTHKFNPYLKLPPLTDIKMRVTQATDNNSNISGDFSLLLETET